MNEKIKNGNISTEKSEENQKKFKSNLSQIRSGNPKYREKYQLYAIETIRNLYNSRQELIDFFNDYAKIRSEAINLNYQKDHTLYQIFKKLLSVF